MLKNSSELFKLYKISHTLKLWDWTDWNDWNNCIKWILKKVLLTHSLPDNLKARDASASKKETNNIWRILTSSQSSVDAIDSWIANSWIAQFTNTARRVSQNCKMSKTSATGPTGPTVLGLAMRLRIHAVHADDPHMRICASRCACKNLDADQPHIEQKRVLQRQILQIHVVWLLRC